MQFCKNNKQKNYFITAKLTFFGFIIHLKVFFLLKHNNLINYNHLKTMIP